MEVDFKETGDEDNQDVHKEDEEMKDDDANTETEKYPNLAQVTKLLKKMKYWIIKSEKDHQHRFLQVESHDKFKFVDQKHYDKLGDLLCDWIQALMMDKFKLQKVMVPLSKHLNEGKAQAPIFVSEDFETNTEKALILIQGTGDVRSGYWARSVCMNDTIELGSMIPDIEFAQKYGFSVLVMNPNYTKDEEGNSVDKQVKGMNAHSLYVWENFVEENNCPAKELFIVAHSAGGYWAHQIIVEHENTMVEKVKAIALTDACHGNFYDELRKDGKKWAAKSCKAYDASNKPLDTELKTRKSDFPNISAGHSKHVYTTGWARESYLKWFLERSNTLQSV